MFSIFWEQFAAYHHAMSSHHGTSIRFEQTYRCYPASTSAKPHLEDGDKVILPASALDRLTALHIDYPMQFELLNASAAAAADDQSAAPKTSHCGVLEFVADEGAVVMPDWMMKNMGLKSGDAVHLRSAALPKGTYVKLRPHTSEFLEVSNPKAVLEKTLRTFSCFTTGDTIMVSYNNKSYYIDIVETKPAEAVSIIETDCEVDFAPPLDYKEPEKPVQKPAVVNVPAASSNKKAPAGGEGGEDDAVVKDDKAEFKPFTGSGKRLDGKEASKPQALSEAVPASSTDPNGGRAKKQLETSGASSSTRQKTGKLVFGSSASNSKEQAQSAPPVKKQAEEPVKKDEPKFQAFTGKSYSLQR